MNVQLQSYFAKNEQGESILKLEMVNLDCIKWLKFNLEIEIEYNKHRGMKKSVDELKSPDTSPEKEFTIIQHILSQVTTIEGIKNCIMHSSSEDVDDKSQTAQLHTEHLLDFALKTDAKPFTPFIADKNSFYYQRFTSMLPTCFLFLSESNRSYFEANISGNLELEEKYVHHFSNEASFYYVDLVHLNDMFKFYIMKTSDVILFYYNKTH